jgi:hypothetical protein
MMCGMERRPLRKLSRIFIVFAYMDASIAVDLELFSSSLQWNVNFIKAAHNWEIDVLDLFFNLLYSIRVRQEGED